MAIYHLSSQVISHGKGETAVAAAAYRSGSKLYCDYDGQVYDYQNKQWIEHTDILLPNTAPEEWCQREVLWNKVEKKTKIDERIAREFEIALPRELDFQTNVELVKEFCLDEFVSRGLVADIAIHNPPLHDDLNRPLDRDGNPTEDKSKMTFPNPHCHILTTMRPLDHSGKWLPKTQIEYICQHSKTGEQRGLTSEEFTAQKDEWFKLYRYIDETGGKVWLIKQEAEVRGLQRIHKNPRTTPYGRQSPEIAYLNSPDYIVDIRKAWQEQANTYIKTHSPATQEIDCRSYLEQGILKESTIHLGPVAVNMQRRDERLRKAGQLSSKISDRAGINSVIHDYNRWSDQILRKAHQIDDEIKTVIRNINELLLYLRSKMILLYYQLLQHRDKLKDLRITAEKFQVLSMLMNKAKRFQNEKQNSEVKPEDHIRTEYISTQLFAYGYSSIDELSYDLECMKNTTEQFSILEEEKRKCKMELDNCFHEYMVLAEQAGQEARISPFRKQTTSDLGRELSLCQQSGFREDLFRQSVREIDRKLHNNISLTSRNRAHLHKH